MTKIESIILPVIVLVGVGWIAGPAQACSLAASTPHTLDAQAQATDSTPPGAPTVTVTSIQRGKGPSTDFGSCSQSASSCGDIGTITLQLSASDDQTSADKLGYQIALAAGQLPTGMPLPNGAVRAFTGGVLYLHWEDGASDNQEALSFSLTIQAVDLAGNVGPAATIQVNDSGSGSGCAVAVCRMGSAWPTSAFAVLFVAYLCRHRRARPRATCSTV